LKAASALLLLVCAQVCAAGELIQRWPDSKHDWRIVEQATSADGKTYAVVISVPGGIFPAAILLEDPKIEKVTLRLLNIRMAEGISFHPLKAAPRTDKVVWKDAEFESGEHELKKVTGFRVTADAQDQVLEFTGKALELLRRGGRFQFIDAYRR
jgi:hypothetical protein